jgi:hypothetical protein
VEHYVANDFSVAGGRGEGVIGEEEMADDKFLNPNFSVFISTVRLSRF